MSSDWKYYNHALIPNCAPHKMPNLEELKDKSIWKQDGKKALFARWITDWDCGYETDWWYIIREGDFSIETLNKSSRKNINRSLKNIESRKIDPKDYIDDLWKVYKEAIVKYKNIDNYTNEKEFKLKCINSNENEEYWGGFLKDTNKLVGYKICILYDEYVDMSVSKYSVFYLKSRVSDAMSYEVINYYLNIQNKKYILNGSRSINHETNVQDYYQEHFKFRKAYCNLHIKYNPIVYMAVKILYPFKGLIGSLNFGITRKISSVLRMEEVARKSKGKYKNG